MTGMAGGAPRISVGIPVYNGEPFLHEALSCLSRQDVTDVEFIICDNASTDRTGEIAADFAARDKRFSIMRQSATKPAEENFADVLDAARGKFFCWRAADDLSSDNFLSELAALLERDEGLMLATCRTDNIRGANPAVFRSRHLPVVSGKPGAVWRILTLLHHIRAAAFYGLWRRSDITRMHADVRARFPYLLAQDVLILLGPILQGRVATTNKAIFVQRLKDKDDDAEAPFYAVQGAAEQAKVRSAFLALALEQLRSVEAPPPGKLVLRLATGLYVDRRVFRLWRIRLAQLTGRAARNTG